MDSNICIVWIKVGKMIEIDLDSTPGLTENIPTWQSFLVGASRVRFPRWMCIPPLNHLELDHPKT